MLSKHLGCFAVQTAGYLSIEKKYVQSSRTFVLFSKVSRIAVIASEAPSSIGVWKQRTNFLNISFRKKNLLLEKILIFSLKYIF